MLELRAMQIRVKLMGVLKPKTPPGGELEVADGATIEDVLRALAIEPQRIRVFTVNGQFERDRNPASENLALRHSADELEDCCCRIEDLQHMSTVAELRNVIKGHVVDELAALEKHPPLEMGNAGVRDLDSARNRFVALIGRRCEPWVLRPSGM